MGKLFLEVGRFVVMVGVLHSISDLFNLTRIEPMGRLPLYMALAVIIANYQRAPKTR